jgi:hypothetical protein
VGNARATRLEASSHARGDVTVIHNSSNIGHQSCAPSLSPKCGSTSTGQFDPQSRN